MQDIFQVPYLYVYVYLKWFCALSTCVDRACVANAVTLLLVHRDKLVTHWSATSVFIAILVCLPLSQLCCWYTFWPANFSNTLRRIYGERIKSILSVVWSEPRKLYIFLFAKDIFHQMNVTLCLLLQSSNDCITWISVFYVVMLKHTLFQVVANVIARQVIWSVWFYNAVSASLNFD